jgi:hypothetical protein
MKKLSALSASSDFIIGSVTYFQLESVAVLEAAASSE